MKTTVFVLYIEHDWGPHNVSVHGSLPEAERALRKFCDEQVGPSDHVKDIVGTLAEYNEYARIYRCDGNGSVEIRLSPVAA